MPKIAVAGCGYWGSNLIRNFASLGALVAVTDTSHEAAKRASEANNVDAISWQQLLESESVEGVAIATPAASHAELAIEAIQAGKHVFVEKPIALSVQDAERVDRVARDSDRILMVGHLLQYHPAFRELKGLTDAGSLGQIQYLYSNRLNFGQIRRVENILWSFSPHDLSMILSIVGEEPEEVRAVGAAYLHKKIADVTTTHLSFPGGAAAHTFVSWLHPYKEQKLVVVGDRGMAVFDDTLPWEEKLRFFPHEVTWRNGVPSPAKAESQSIAVSPDEPLRVECNHFLDCMRTGSQPVTDGAEALRVLRVLVRAEESMRPGSESGRMPHPSDDAEFFVHPTAVVDEGVQIGKGTKIWHFAHLLKGTVVGEECVLGQNVMAGPDAIVGDRCRVQNNVSIYKGVTLEDDVFIGPSAVFTNVSTPRSGVDRSGDFSPTTVKKGATIGANATVVCGNELGSYCMIAAGAVVTRDVAAHALVAGVPARQMGWVSHTGDRLGDDLICPTTGQRYRETPNGLAAVDGD